jgi:hypothetical protein
MFDLATSNVLLAAAQDNMGGTIELSNNWPSAIAS